MATLSFTQEYYLCAINQKGNIPFSNYSCSVCLLIGGILELLHQDYLVLTARKKLVAGKIWDDALPYLKPLYDTIISLKRPKDAKGIVSVYMFVLSQKKLNEFLAAIGTALTDAGQADELQVTGLINDKTKYVPKAAAVTNVIEKIRAEFLEDGPISEETLCLAALLDSSHLIRSYFSKVEVKAMKRRLKEVRKTDASALMKETLEYIYCVWNGIG